MKNDKKDFDMLLREIDRLKAENQSLLKLASHDLRSPLNKVFALVNLLKMSDSPLSDEQKGYLEKIELTLSDGLQRMRNLMDLRALEGEQIKVFLEQIDIAALLSRIVREHRTAAERKQQRLVLTAVPVKTATDKLILTRVLDQLISNAIKFSPVSSEIQLALITEQDRFILSIIDGGYGIADTEQGDLFKKFSVLSTPTTGGESKTGLGLYIAQNNAALIKGRISYNNDAGSRFMLELPFTGMA